MSKLAAFVPIIYIIIDEIKVRKQTIYIIYRKKLK